MATLLTLGFQWVKHRTFLFNPRTKLSHLNVIKETRHSLNDKDTVCQINQVLMCNKCSDCDFRIWLRLYPAATCGKICGLHVCHACLEYGNRLDRHVYSDLAEFQIFWHEEQVAANFRQPHTPGDLGLTDYQSDRWLCQHHWLLNISGGERDTVASFRCSISLMIARTQKTFWPDDDDADN